MPSKRLSRTNEDIKFLMSRLLTEVKDPRVHQGLISVTAVETTGDLKYCKVWLSVLGLENEKEFLRGLKSANGWFRRELGRRLNLRNTPEITFLMDRSIAEGAHINALLAELNIPNGDEDEDGNDAV